MTVSNIVQTVSLIAGEAVPLYRFVQIQADGKVDLADDTYTAEVAGTAQVDTITANAAPPAGGTFDLHMNGRTLSEIAYNVTPAALQTALRALWADEVTDAVTCTCTEANLGVASAVMTLTWLDDMGLVDMAIDTDELLDAAGTAQVDTITANATPATAGTFDLQINGLFAGEIAYNVTAAALQTDLRALLLSAGYGADMVTCTCTEANLGVASAVMTLTFDESMGLVDIVLEDEDLTGNVHVLAQTTAGVDGVLNVHVLAQTTAGVLPTAAVVPGPINGVSASASTADLDVIAVSLPMGINKVTAGAAVSVGDQVTTDSTGRAITHVSGAGGWIAGFALDAASAAGEIIRVYTQVMQDGVT